MRIAIGVALVCILSVMNATAAPLYPSALTFEPGYASGPPDGFPWWAMPSMGAPLTIVGKVATVGAPFEDLVPAGGYELTYAFQGSTCTQSGNWDNIPCSGGLFGTFQSGGIAWYLDTTPDADFTNLATFLDGELVLLAETSYVYVLDDDPEGACPMVESQPDVTAYLAFTGGTWFSRVSNQGKGLTGISEGELDNSVPAGLAALGYIFRVDGNVDIFGPVAVQSTTWG